VRVITGVIALALPVAFDVLQFLTVVLFSSLIIPSSAVSPCGPAHMHSACVYFSVYKICFMFCPHLMT